MRFLLVLLLHLVPATAAAVDCDALKDSGDGVPAEYYMEECKGNRALAARNGKLATEHFRKALAVQKFEAPNYELKVELAESLCLQGLVDEARHELAEFQCMSSVELGERECPVQGPASPACAAVCEGFGSSLSNKGKSMLRARRAKAEKILASCRSPSPPRRTGPGKPDPAAYGKH